MILTTARQAIDIDYQQYIANNEKTLATSVLLNATMANATIPIPVICGILMAWIRLSMSGMTRMERKSMHEVALQPFRAQLLAEDDHNNLSSIT